MSIPKSLFIPEKKPQDLKSKRSGKFQNFHSGKNGGLAEKIIAGPGKIGNRIVTSAPV
jgi:hypothetical protein